MCYCDRVKPRAPGTRKILIVCAVVFVLAGAAGVFFGMPGRFYHSRSRDYFIPINHEETFTDLFAILEQEGGAGEARFAVVREIANAYYGIKEYGRLINFLNEWVYKNPDDLYNGYYLLMIAYSFMQQDASPAAALYFSLILNNCPDLYVKGESLHLICLRYLIQLDSSPDRQAQYYQQLIARFPDKIDLGASYFALAQAYEKIGEWDEAIRCYTLFLPYSDTQIPGFEDAYSYAKRLTDLAASPRNWTFPTLGGLVATLKWAIDSRDGALLSRCRSRVGFFTKSWEQETNEDNRAADTLIYAFSYENEVTYENQLDPSSNAYEAYLRTSGWAQYYSVWYLYFRKINFPADPEVHGNWEWAGIYYGDKF
jgi:tetratricopeptide (TPR) repeat protein